MSGGIAYVLDETGDFAEALQPGRASTCSRWRNRRTFNCCTKLIRKHLEATLQRTRPQGA